MSSTTDSTIILRSPDDWDKWDKQFRAKAVTNSLWEHINPDAPDPKAFLTEPEEPTLSDYTTTCELTEGESSTTGHRTCQQRAVTGTLTSITDLTIEGQKAFQLA